ERLRTEGEHYFKQMLTSYFIRAVRTPTMEILGAIAVGALVGFLGYVVMDGRSDPAQYVSFLVAIFMMYDPLKKLGHVSDFLAVGSAAAERIFELKEAESEIIEKPNALPLHQFSKGISFNNVSFSYGDTPILQHINLDVRRGQRVALVGQSGAGKTTLVNLVPRFYDVSQGSLLVDGHNVRDLQ